MKTLSKVILATILTFNITAAYAICTTHSSSYQGVYITCTTCCTPQGNCITTCN